MSIAQVLPFATADETQADLDTVGGKGQSLARLTAAAFAVPAGFTVTTVTYRQFVAAQHLQEAIIDLAKPEIGARTVSLSRRCSKIST